MLIILAVGAEISLRCRPPKQVRQAIYWQRYHEINMEDPELGTTLRPEIREVSQMFGEREVIYKINEEGFRGPVLDSCDIGFLGDSTAWGSGVEYDEIFPALVGKNTGLAFANYARAAIGTQQETVILKRYLLPKKPSLVICCFYHNDFDEAMSYDHWKRSGKSWFEFARVPPPSGRIRLKIYLEAKLLGKWKQKESAPVQSTLEEYREIMRKALLDMRDACASADAGFAIVLFPSVDNVYGEKEFKYPKHHVPIDTKREAGNFIFLKQLFEKEKIPFLDLTKPLQQAVAGGRSDLFFPDDGHFSHAGHALVAEKILDWMKTGKLLDIK
ncbi:MAG: SGNH/GDSL hydrolase family protein [Planctomycetota bacterium]